MIRARGIVASAGLAAAALLAGLAFVPALSRPGATPPRAAIFIHGGGWTAGSAAAGDRLDPFFTRHHFLFRAIDYPKPPRSTVAESIRQSVAQIDAAGANGISVTVIGHSAGAQIAASAVFDLALHARVRCAILLDGIGYDLPRLLTERPGLQSRLALDPARARALSPAERVEHSARRPAIFLAAGNDARGTWGEAQAFAATLRARGVAVTIEHFPQMAHARFLQDFARDDSDLSRAIAAFLAAHNGCA